MKHDETVRVDENKKINGKYFKLSFHSSKLSRQVLPGQFLNIQIHPTLDPFLRRPFSYYRVQGNKIEVMYEILGRATAFLAKFKKGDLLKVMGPLGRSFSPKSKKKKVMVAGGVGVPPLLFLARRSGADYFLIGAKSKDEVLPKKELTGVPGKISYATNDGSYGRKGFVTVLLEELILRESAKNLFIQTCGPRPMMDAVISIARREGIEGEASLDETMACGVGACLGCMVKTVEGWLPSCTQGPVFCFDKLSRS